MISAPGKKQRCLGLTLLTVAVAGLLFAWLPPIAQWPAYHDFADRRPWLGIPNGLNVISNLPFSLIGLLGLARLLDRRRAAFLDPRERWAWRVMFACLLALGPASAWYHLAPDNGRLVVDRLAMSGVFMSWLAVHLGERISPRLGAFGLPVLLAVGAASVLYWGLTEAAGVGDLRPYAFVHFYPVLLIVLLVTLFPARYPHSGDIFVVLGLYVLALVAEGLDGVVFGARGWISGHTLKHLLAAAAAFSMLRMLNRRQIPSDSR